MGAEFVTLHGNDHFFEQRTQQLLLVTIRGGGSGPYTIEIGPEGTNALIVFGAQRAGTRLAFVFQFGLRLLEITQALFPRSFQSTSDKPVLRIHGTIASFCTFRFVARSLHSETPLRKRRIVVGLELLRGLQRRLKGGRFEGFNKGLCDGLVDLHAADVQTVDTAAIDDVLAGAVITRTCVSSRILGAQLAATVTAARNALQQGGAFSHGPSRLVWSGTHVLANARLVGLIGGPVNIAFVMRVNQNCPLRLRQLAAALLDFTLIVEHAFM